RKTSPTHLSPTRQQGSLQPRLRFGLRRFGLVALQGRDGSVQLERADVGGTTTALLPGLVNALAVEAVLDGHRGLDLHVLHQRRIERRLVAADLVVLAVEAARLDLRHAGVQHDTGVVLARADVQVDGTALDADDVAEQGAGLALRQSHKRVALAAVGAAVDDQHRLGLARLGHAERVAGGDDGDDAEAVQGDVVEAALVDLPAENGVLAVEVDLGV